jgi:hypothetical protein
MTMDDDILHFQPPISFGDLALFAFPDSQGSFGQGCGCPFSMFTTQDLEFLVSEIINELDRRLEDPDLEDDSDFEEEPECGPRFR